MLKTVSLPDFSYNKHVEYQDSPTKKIARSLTLLENKTETIEQNKKKYKKPIVVGLTGTGGAGKSSLLDELLRRFLLDYKDIKIAILCFDPSKKKTGGALLGDRIRINSCSDSRIFLHSFANRQSIGKINPFRRVLGRTQNAI